MLTAEQGNTSSSTTTVAAVAAARKRYKEYWLVFIFPVVLSWVLPLQMPPLPRQHHLLPHLAPACLIHDYATGFSHCSPRTMRPN